jgi:hypothetical protein
VLDSSIGAIIKEKTMFVGKSEEEAELAGEEMGWSFNPVDAVKNIFGNKAVQQVAATSIFGPSAGAALAIANAARGSSAPPPKPAKKMATSKSQEDPTAETAPKTTSVGAASYSDDHIAQLISREADPEKRQRMIYNHDRAKRMRSPSMMGSQMPIVDRAIGALFARTPVDAQGNPSMDRTQVGMLIKEVARRTRNPMAARTLVAGYIGINKIATPGLKVRRK